MKSALLLILISIQFLAFSQDTTFYGRNGVIIENKANALTYKIIVKDKDDTNKVNSKFYYPSDNIKSEQNYSNYSEEIYHGTNRVWYETGELKKTVTFQNGLEAGDLVTYWKSGTIRRIDKYKNGEFKRGKVYDSLGKREKYYDYYQDAFFNTEHGSLKSFIKDNLQYPQEAVDNNEEGRVRVSFVVDNDGSIIDVEILDSVSESLDEEAIRLVKSMPNWIPAKQDGENSRQRFAFPLNFQL